MVSVSGAGVKVTMAVTGADFALLTVSVAMTVKPSTSLAVWPTGKAWLTVMLALPLGWLNGCGGPLVCVQL